MKLRAVFAVIVCKLLRAAVRLLGRGGTAKPGSIALKICPDLLSVLAKDVNTIVITGTNGKTTCSRMVEQVLREAGCDYLANRSGANLISGITTEFAMNSSVSCACRKKWAVIECDEAAARRVLPQLKPKAVVVTNLFHDQLDRFGEVRQTLENIRAGLQAVPETAVCLNADCPMTASLADSLPNKTLFFGFGKAACTQGREAQRSDITRCPGCGKDYVYSHVSYGHLGHYICSGCGKGRPEAQVELAEIKAMDSEGSDVLFSVSGREIPGRVALPAVYNIYNAAAAVCGALALGIDADIAIAAMGSFSCGFGRMEKLALGEKGATMMLVKNTAGCQQVVEFLAAIEDEFELVISVNDNWGDGRDVSWLWDVDFEKLADKAICGITVSGIRAEDVLLRLKYAGIGQERIRLEKNCDKIVESLKNADRPIYIIPSYSAMLEVRSCIVKHCGGSEFWEG